MTSAFAPRRRLKSRSAQRDSCERSWRTNAPRSPPAASGSHAPVEQQSFCSHASVARHAATPIFDSRRRHYGRAHRHLRHHPGLPRRRHDRCLPGIGAAGHGGASCGDHRRRQFGRPLRRDCPRAVSGSDVRPVAHPALGGRRPQSRRCNGTGKNLVFRRPGLRRASRLDRLAGKALLRSCHRGRRGIARDSQSRMPHGLRRLFPRILPALPP